MPSRIQRALISATNKEGIIEFATYLRKRNVEILATAGSAQLLREHNIPVVAISDYTGFPEILGGRVKTLHPQIFAGLLQRPSIDSAVLQQYNIQPIDLLIVNLYSFAEKTATPDCTIEEAIEHIDVGGPSLLRAGAKNYQHVTVLVDPQDYFSIMEELEAHDGQTTLATRGRLARKTFAYLSHYDAQIAAYFAQTVAVERFPESFAIPLRKQMDLRYGENPHQQAALYNISLVSKQSLLAQAEQKQGKPMSFNNWMDADCAYRCVYALTHGLHKSACVIVKHSTPCGAACANTVLEAYTHAYATDPTSAFGGIVAFNRPLDKETAACIVGQQFVEVIIAPGVDEQALAVLQKKPQCRLLIAAPLNPAVAFSYHTITGGLLIQEEDQSRSDPTSWSVMGQCQPNAQEWDDLIFAWKVVQYAKSNAIVLAKAQSTLGVGTGQTSRVFAVKIAVMKAQEANLSLTGAVLASDAFFPFADSIHLAAEAGITAIVQPGGSKRDAEVIAAADKANIALVFTHERHFRH